MQTASDMYIKVSSKELSNLRSAVKGKRMLENKTLIFDFFTAQEIHL